MTRALIESPGLLHPLLLVLYCSFAAAYKPYILITGANHAQTTQSPVNEARGDLPAALSDAEALSGFSRVIGAFLTAHEGVNEGVKREAVAELVGMCGATAEMIGAYYMANGEGRMRGGWE
jgi:hypothetical protein